MRDHSCIICNSPNPVYLFRYKDAAIVTCSECHLVSKQPPSTAKPEIVPANNRQRQASLSEAAYIEKLVRAADSSSILLVAENEKSDLENCLRDRGLSFTKKNEAELLSAQERNQYDCVILNSLLDTSVDPSLLLSHVHQVLKTGGQLLVAGTRINKQANYEGMNHRRNWQDNNFSFSRSTLQMLLEKSGFHKILLSSDQSSAAFRPILSARAVTESKTNKLSIIMPVYNEKNTFEQAFSLVANKRIEGIDETEIIIVESNSTDGSREAVQSIAAGAPNVKAIFENKPQGKGHAVREGFKHATGNIILIQDADLEYDIDDYDALVKPLLEYKQTFVLGTRHSGDWKIRQFAGQRFFALICNIGHIFFTLIINTLYRQSLSDPFTMFKVFRRECIYGLHFECNRFDFDHELVIKLIRKGYQPIEIPINYNSRSFAEGKKVTFFRDPITWLRADLKYRFADPFDRAIVASNQNPVQSQKSKGYDEARISL
jgi:glycosyltransferase involved in cell wall biosynthesis